MTSPIQQAIVDIAAGKMVIVTDAPERENEGDLVMAAELVTPQAINFMSREGRGLICLPITSERAESLSLSPMVKDNTSLHHTNFSVSIDARHGITTGIGAAERAKTILDILHAKTRPEDLCRPGHVFPIIADPGGVLVRPGHTEAAVDLARLAGLTPAGVVCEILDEEGNSCRGQKLVDFAEKHKLTMISIEELQEYLSIV